jgi:hypothetical protein
VVIAAITSCTNTSNPSVLIAAGLLARNANKGPEGQAVGEDLAGPRIAGGHRLSDAKSGLQKDLDALGFNLVGYGCTTCIGNSGPLPEPISKAINDNGLIAARCCRATATSKAASPGRAGELPRLAAAGRRLCAGRLDADRPDQASRSARTRRASRSI